MWHILFSLRISARQHRHDMPPNHPITNFWALLPKVYRALVDYYEIVTENAGDSQNRWPKKLYELDEIRVGLDGNSLAAQVASARIDIQISAPDKLPIIDQIVETHLLLTAGLMHWHAFVHSAGEANVNEEKVEKIIDFAEILQTQLELLPAEVDEHIPQSIQILRNLMNRPIATARLGAYGVVRCVESMFNAIFSFVRRFISKTGDEVVQKGPPVVVTLLITTLLGAGVENIFMMFPHIGTWLETGISVLKTISILH